MPPLRLIAEVISSTHRHRDYIHKRAQYAAIAIPEYWLLDPVAQTVMVLSLDGEGYQEVVVFIRRSSDRLPRIRSVKINGWADFRDRYLARFASFKQITPVTHLGCDRCFILPTN